MFVGNAVLGGGVSSESNILKFPDSSCALLNESDVDLRKMRRWKREVLREQRAGMYYTIEPALTPEDFACSISLVHDSYVVAGHMRSHDSGLRVRSGYDTNSSVVTFIARDVSRQQVVGTLSVVSSSDLGLPSEDVFGQEMGAIKTQSRYSVEATGWAVHPHYRRSTLSYDLARHALGWVAYTGVDSAFSVISPSAKGFFSEVLLFFTVGSEKSYSPVICDPVVCVWSNPQESRIKAVEIDRALGDDAFLADYLFFKNPVYRFVKYPGIKQVRSAYHHVLADAMMRYLGDIKREVKKKVAQL